MLTLITAHPLKVVQCFTEPSVLNHSTTLIPLMLYQMLSMPLVVQLKHLAQLLLSTHLIFSKCLVLLMLPTLVIGDLNKPIKRIAWCTGGAQGYINEAISMKVDAYISGEVSEQTFHAAQESGVAYIAAGHHATERYGVGALGEFVAQKYKLSHQFVDIPNPV
jgi:putative NIF3 family GTP cyclohydrolase 1 type 2